MVALQGSRVHEQQKAGFWDLSVLPLSITQLWNPFVWHKCRSEVQRVAAYDRNLQFFIKSGFTEAKPSE
jgi:hypothetical protein